MSAENEAYQEGQRLLKELTALRNDVLKGVITWYGDEAMGA